MSLDAAALDGGFAVVFGFSFLVALTGAMAPGPLLTYTIRQSLHTGPLAGFFVIIAGNSAADFAYKKKALEQIVSENDGKSIESSRELTKTIADIEVGKKTTVTLLRDGNEKRVNVKIAKRGDAEPLAQRKSEDSEGLGIRIAEATPETAKRFGHSETEKGVLVVGVEPGSKAAQAGVRQGDMVKEVNRKPITSVSELRSEVEKNDNVQLLVKRPNAGFVVIKIS